MTSSSDCVTHGVRVQTVAAYVPERSDPERDTYFFAYRITISNERSDTVQLRSRHWLIINADGATEEVAGEGVIGERPRLAAGESFTYTSFCPLNTHWGTMEGTYHFQSESGEQLEVAIARFVLAMPVPAATSV